nr:V-set and immunoglobulin domain-containing protein 2-like [Pogona vitticeps]
MNISSQKPYSGLLTDRLEIGLTAVTFYLRSPNPRDENGWGWIFRFQVFRSRDETSHLLPCSDSQGIPVRLGCFPGISGGSFCLPQVLAYVQGEVVESLSHYTGRVAFAFSPTKSATIILNDTRGLDSGIYQCSVTNPPDTSTPNIGVVRLTVFVPPSNPRCSSEGTTEEGGSLQFSCTVEEGMPLPTFTWEKIPPENTQPLVVSYEDDRRALLPLPNLTADASGLYRCLAANMLGSVSCVLELRVHVAPHGPTSLVVGITLMLSMGLVLLTLFALGLWLHHDRVAKWPENEEEDSHNEIRIDSFSLGRLIVAPSGDGLAAPSASKPLWIFTSSTPNTTFAHREWRPRTQKKASQAAPPGGLQPPAPAGPGRWRSASLSERQDSLSRSEEKHPTPKPIGFLV